MVSSGGRRRHDCSKFVIVEYRRGQRRLFAGTYRHDLVLIDGRSHRRQARGSRQLRAPLDGLLIPF
jgi:hypothetical protein